MLHHSSCHGLERMVCQVSCIMGFRTYIASSMIASARLQCGRYAAGGGYHELCVGIHQARRPQGTPSPPLHAYHCMSGLVCTRA